MADTPSALQLRLLQTVMAVAAEKNSTLVLPIPVELLRFLERGQQPAAQAPGHAEAADRAELAEGAVDRREQAEEAMEQLRRAVEQ
jgi:hypothetical protein